MRFKRSKIRSAVLRMGRLVRVVARVRAGVLMMEVSDLVDRTAMMGVAVLELRDTE